MKRSKSIPDPEIRKYYLGKGRNKLKAMRTLHQLMAKPVTKQDRNYGAR